MSIGVVARGKNIDIYSMYLLKTVSLLNNYLLENLEMFSLIGSLI